MTTFQPEAGPGQPPPPDSVAPRDSTAHAPTSGARLNDTIRGFIEKWGSVWVEGEITSWNVRGGHVFGRLKDLGTDATIARIRDVVGSGPTYISFDIDSLDPGFAPGTGTPEVGGLAPREAMALIRGAAGLDIVGGDVVEIAPAYDPTTATAQAGAQMLFEIVSVIATARARNSGRS